MSTSDRQRRDDLIDDFVLEREDVLVRPIEAGGPDVASKLSSGESSEISITPGIDFGAGARIDEFDYKLTLKYFAKLLFLKRTFSKVWKIELKNQADEFYWEVTIV